MESVNKDTTLDKLLILAVIAGMRSMMAPALLALNLKETEKSLLTAEGIAFVGRPETAKTLAVLATAEFVGDKLPFIPSRLSRPQLTGRSLSGASVGSLTYQLAGRKKNEGALIGAGVAIASSLLFFTLRKGLSKSRILPEPLVGLVEDMFAFYLAGKYLKLNNDGQNVANQALSEELELV